MTQLALNRALALRIGKVAFGLVCVLTLAALVPGITGYMVMATGAYFLLFSGMYFRRIDSKLHATLMSVGVLSDLSLVAILEFQRHAVATAVSFTLSPLQQAHVFSSSLATLLYFPLIGMGAAMTRRPVMRSKYGSVHGKMGLVAFFFRTLGFVLMFSLIGHARSG